MKKLIAILLVVLLGTTTLPAQETLTRVPLTKADYLKKSKGQKTAGFVFLGIGAACFAIAAPGETSFDALPVLVIGGAGCVIASVPLFIASAKNKKRAAAMSACIRTESLYLSIRNTGGKEVYPAFSLRLNL